MAKGKSKKAKQPKGTKPAVSSDAPKEASVPRVVRKHLRELQNQLADAARKEYKRLVKLERASLRRQSIQSALDDLRAKVSVAARADEPVDTTKPANPPAPAVETTSTPKAPRSRTGATRPAAGRVPTARAGTVRRAAASTKAAPKPAAADPKKPAD
jgi:hypothetical protein